MHEQVRVYLDFVAMIDADVFFSIVNFLRGTRDFRTDATQFFTDSVQALIELLSASVKFFDTITPALHTYMSNYINVEKKKKSSETDWPNKTERKRSLLPCTSRSPNPPLTLHILVDPLTLHVPVDPLTLHLPVDPLTLHHAD